MMTLFRLCSVTILGMLAVLTFPRSAMAVDAPAGPSVTPIYYQLVLESSMVAGGNPQDVRELVLDLEQVGDHWGAIYGVSRNYNMAFHKGAVRDAKTVGDTLTLGVGMEITPDKWIPGGQGEYTVILKREADGRLSGSHKGKYNGIDVTGKVTGTVYAPSLLKGFTPLAPQEHPRLLFRKSDLPALREKAKTAFGQAAIKAIEAQGTPMALGVLYQLTGDKAWAVKAQAEAEQYLNGNKPPASPFVPLMHMWGKLEHLAMVYDLCYDTLTDDFKARYRAWISDLTFQAYFAPENLGIGVNWHVVSNHTANVYSGLALGGLTLFDEPAAAPKEPTPPFLDETLQPVKDFKPAEGVPVVELTPGKSPTLWLRTEALRRVTPDDPREVFYGLETMSPQPGTKVKVGDFQLTFDKMTPEEKSTADIGGLRVGHILEANAAAKLKQPFTMVAYSVIEVKEPGQYTVSFPVSRSNLAQMSLAGKLVADRQVLKLEKGFYPLMCMVQWRMKWSEIAPSLQSTTPADVKAWAALADQLRTQHQTRLQGFATVMANWKRTGGGDPAFARMLRLARFTSTLHCSDAVGRGGFQGESGHYSVDASFGHAQLWPVYRRVMGFDLTPYHEYPDYLPRKIIGGPQDITGATFIGDQYFASLLPVSREEWQPELLTAWHNEFKVADPAMPLEVLKGDPVRTFINYPLDMKPAPIGTKLPRVWEAPGLGYYAFRSGWDKDAFVAQVALRHQVISGWAGQNAGTYRLLGLGQEWVTGTTDRYRSRPNESVVWMPDAGLTDSGCGHLTYLKADDKTMVLSVDLNEVYEKNGRYWYSSYGHLRTIVAPLKDKPVPEASGITGMRSLAFDYSGESGAPCLFVVVDKIVGGKDVNRLWLFQPPAEKNITADGRGFTVTPGGSKSTLHGVFAHPASPKVNTEPLVREFINATSTGRGAKITKIINALTVPGQDSYFFVATVTAGTHPEVKVEGAGLDAVVTVGRRTVKFDGEKIVLGTQNQ